MTIDTAAMAPMDVASRLPRLRERLGEEGLAAAWAQGLTMTLEAAIAVALDEGFPEG